MYTDLEFTSIVVENANQLQHNFDVAATVQNIIVVMMMMMILEEGLVHLSESLMKCYI